MLEVRSTVSGRGYLLQVCQRRQEGLLRKKIVFEPVSDWTSGVAALAPLNAAVLDELQHWGKLEVIDASSRLLTFSDAAEVPAGDAELLNLLPSFPFQLDIQSHGTLGRDNFQIDYKATQGGVGIPGSFSHGVFNTEGRAYRLSGVLFSLVTRIEAINAAHTAVSKMEHFAALRLLLPDESSNSGVLTEEYLLRIRIAHVTAISLKPSIVDGDVSFDPVPMRRIDVEDHEAGAELAITPLATEKFGIEFRRQKDVNSTYAIESGQYVFIDPSIRTALRVVKRKQSAPLEERMAFLMSPAKALTEAYSSQVSPEREVPIGETIFFETSQYSDRITGMGEWIPPQLSYLEKGENTWLPERFSVVLAGKLVTGEPEDVPGWIELVRAAIAKGTERVRLGDVELPTQSPGLLPMLQKLRPPEEMPPSGDAKEKEKKERLSRRPPILQTKNNFDSVEFKRQMRPRRLSDDSLPLMRTVLKSHQVDGVSWLTGAYKSGWPGVLLADDMGLGKTLQSLTFLMLLLRERVIRRGRPALVVAPTSLLRNWQDEHDKFVVDEGLGAPLVAFGSHLRDLRLGKVESSGVVLLDAEKISKSNWVLTTYETVRDYHISFAQVPFSIAVLDEVQKAKNPTTRVNATLKALNPEFVLAMTGTPVENSICDLWAITDIAAPGYFAPLKDFMKAYGRALPVEERKVALKSLSEELLTAAAVGGQSVPPYALRRMKEDVAKDLPTKHQSRMMRAFMPELQAQRYAEVSSSTQAGHLNILRALHDFRSISLHPVDPDAVEGGQVQADEYINMSARLSQAFEKLHQIAQRGEKVIIFVNSRRMQTVLSRLIGLKFGCEKPEFIRGDTIPGQRQEIVNRFSRLKGFAALILSPRAAGVGLNIVAANHVIHLDRWWNPAVEDQCTDRAYRIGATKDVHVYTVGAVHPVLMENSYDIILDELLESRRDTSRRVFVSSEITVGDFAEALGAKTQGQSAEQLLRDIDRSGFLGLEEFVRDRLILRGFEAGLTKKTGDGGADIVVRDEIGNIIYLIQCKYTNSVDQPVDGGLVLDAQRVKANWQAEDAIVVGVSNGRKFAPRVVDEFSKIGGRLISRDQLPKLPLP